jgi:class 3 adenylate cyclase
LSYVFGEFDKVVNKYKLDKIKTVGDAYLLVGGLSGHYTDHPETVVLAATKMKKVMDKTRDRYVPDVDIRIGIHTGPVTAGIIGSGNYFYDIWGDTVNIANRLEDTCPPGQIQMSEETMQRVKDLFPVKHRGVADIKGKGEMNLFCIE